MKYLTNPSRLVKIFFVKLQDVYIAYTNINIYCVFVSKKQQNTNGKNILMMQS